MNALRVFDDEWTELAPRLSVVLGAKGVHAQDRDDLLQETALRLYRVWETLAPDQPVWPFAVTIALNLWRDQVRASVVRQRDVLSANLAEAGGVPAMSCDVERTVLARHELAQVGALMRQLEPEQRRLLLENDEVSAVVAPLRPAERMARMRARRELARLVGRASAALALLVWRRPLRANAFAAVACVGVLAATVMANTPYVAPEPALSLATPSAAPAWTDVPGAVAHSLAAARLRPSMSTHASSPAARGTDTGIASVPRTDVCAAPASMRQRQFFPEVSIGSGGIYQADPSDPSRQRPVVETPPVSTDSGGCVHVG